MRLAVVWFSFREDERQLALSVKSVRENMARPEDGLFIYEEEKKPLSTEVREKLESEYGAKIGKRPGMLNLGGREDVPRKVVEYLKEASQGYEGAWKIDSDTLCFGKRWREVIERENPRMLGAERQGKEDGVYGFGYYIQRDAIEDLLPMIDDHASWHEDAGYAEDVTISTGVLALDGKLGVLPHEPANQVLWAAWDYNRKNAKGEEAASFYKRFDFVTFGNRPLMDKSIKDKRGHVYETMAQSYEAFGEHPDEYGSTPDRQKASTKEEDPTGLLNEGFRYRDPETGTFLTRDPLGFKAGPNMYTYVRQNPWTHFDPEGLEDNSPHRPLWPAPKHDHPQPKLYHVWMNPNDPKHTIHHKIVTSAKDIKNKNNVTIYINGMDNTLIGAEKLGLNHTGKNNFYLLFNPTEGAMRDFATRTIAERLGLGAGLPVEKGAPGILKQFNLTNASIYAHSEGTMILNYALSSLHKEGVNTRGLKLYYDGSAANSGASHNIAKRAGATIQPFEGNPADAVHNIVGFNTINPLRIGLSLLDAPFLFGKSALSPHSEKGGGKDVRWLNHVPILESGISSK